MSKKFRGKYPGDGVFVLQRCRLWNFNLKRKFFIRRHKNKVDSVETGRAVIADLFP